MIQPPTHPQEEETEGGTIQPSHPPTGGRGGRSFNHPPTHPPTHPFTHSIQGEKS